MPSARSFPVAFAASELVDLFARQFEACCLKRGEFCALVAERPGTPFTRLRRWGLVENLGPKGA